MALHQENQCGFLCSFFPPKMDKLKIKRSARKASCAWRKTRTFYIILQISTHKLDFSINLENMLFQKCGLKLYKT